jgi:hypothetical protein
LAEAETAPEVGVEVLDDVTDGEDAPDPLGEVAEGTAKPVMLPVSGPGGAEAEAPTPTR